VLGHRAGGPIVSSSGLAVPARLAREELRWLRPVGLWLRWGAIGFGLVLVAAGVRPVTDLYLQFATALLVAFAAWRSLPGRTSSAGELRAALAVEPIVATVAVLVTGGWSSPFGLYLVIPVLYAGVAFGLWGALLPGVFIAVLVAHEIADGDPAVSGEITQILAPMVVALAVGVVGRRLLRQAEEEHSQTLGRIQQLSHVNALLSALHDLVRTTPAPLTVESVLAVIRDEIDELFDADAVVLLLADSGGRWWRPVHAEGAAVGREIPYADLPAELRDVGPSSRPVVVSRLGEGTGLTPEARSGAYLWLWSRGQPAALLALEHYEPRDLPPTHRDMLDRLSAPLALAIDNAVWFQRLRTLGAEEERQRIGAELHDRFAQSLAYVGMELDRVAARHPDDESITRLREDVRATLADLRETLWELRLRCTEDRGLADVLADYLHHFGERFGVFAQLEAPGELVRPALPVENQLLRIAQDLVALAQREGGATTVSVNLASEPGRLRMVVRDDGRGTPEEELGHQAARALAVVRERADAIGALVDVFTRPGEGAEIAVTVRGLM
jgi:signal transduction histidine kinase